MNEAELVAETIATVKRDGWTRGSLFSESTKQHCILGAIGRARWGTAWDIDCLDSHSFTYARLQTDPLTDSLARRVAAHLRTTIDEDTGDFLGYTEDDLKDESLSHELAMDWNDSLLHSEEELVEVLEKVQAEIGRV